MLVWSICLRIKICLINVGNLNSKSINVTSIKKSTRTNVAVNDLLDLLAGKMTSVENITNIMR